MSIAVAQGAKSCYTTGNMRHIHILPRSFLILLIGGVFVIVGPQQLIWAQNTAPDTATTSPANQGGSIQKQIDAKNDEIKRLEEEAKKYQVTLKDVSSQANTLASQIQRLEQSINGLTANIRVTNAKISRTELEIKDLGENIFEHELSIERQRSRISYLVGTIASGDQQTPLEILMKNATVSEFFTSLDNIVSVQRDIQIVLAGLRKERGELQDRKTKAEGKKLELSSLADELSDQKFLQESQRKERSELLQETKNQEKKYQDLIAETNRKRDALQQEINNLEATLNPNFDRSHLPAPGSGVLGWPLAEPIFITQYFGHTTFARSGGYNGKGHNGIDLRALVGTTVFASDPGTVRATGDTDLVCRRASYGRWVLIDHANGLSTLYGHLSLIKVRPGDGVNRGEVIGYSGQTGYATGPHLHLSVFASQAVSVSPFRSKVCGRMMSVPISPFNGYLNPIDYL